MDFGFGKQGTIPDFNLAGVLPPYLGANSADAALRSPYQTTIADLLTCFAVSDERRQILKGLITYRKFLHDLGLHGFQWIDGSFCEYAEVTRGRPPQDIDLISFVHRPASLSNDNDWSTFIADNKLVDRPYTKKTYGCDAFFVELNGPPEEVVDQVSYWFGLFSHQRDTYLWKGMLRIPLGFQDNELTLLGGL